jgi:hypothetical protein
VTADEVRNPTMRAGDVLVPLVGRRLIARVADGRDVGAYLSPTVYLIRPDRASVDPWFLAGLHRERSIPAGPPPCERRDVRLGLSRTCCRASKQLAERYIRIVIEHPEVEAGGVREAEVTCGSIQ